MVVGHVIYGEGVGLALNSVEYSKEHPVAVLSIGQIRVQEKLILELICLIGSMEVPALES